MLIKEAMTTNFIKDIRSIKSRKVYTYVGFDSRGYPYREIIDLLYMRYIPIVGVNESYLLVGKASGKYKKSVRLDEQKQFLLYEGRVMVDINFIVHTGTADWDQSGHCKESKRWPAYDTRYLLRAIHSCAIKPFIFNYKSELEPEILLTCQVIS